MSTQDRSVERHCQVCGQFSAHETAFVKNGFQIVRCLNCGVGGTLTGADFSPAKIYDAGYFEGGHTDGYGDYSRTEGVLRAEFRKLLGQLGRRFPLGGRLVEVGSAYGYFLMEARQYFDVCGYEISEAAAKQANAKGLNTVCGIVTEEALRDTPPIDVAVMLDVIEHLATPADVLSALRKHMKPGGGLVITTGDWSSIYSRIAKTRWRLMTPPQHLFFFTPRSMNQLLRRTGFEVVQITRPWKIVPVSLMLFQLGRLLGGRPIRAEYFSRIGLPVNLFDAMQVIARAA